MSRSPLWGGLAVLALACSGSQAPAPGTPVQQPPPAPSEAVQTEPAADSAEAARAAQTQLVREVFSYRSGGRDPFRSLIASGDVRPLFDDLRLMGVAYDPRYPARSVAVLRDVSVNKRYEVRVDDELGRMRVVTIRATEVVLAIEEFGVERQMTLTLRKRQEGIP